MVITSKRRTSFNISVDMQVGERISYFRKYFNISQKKLSEKIGISVQQIHKYEHGYNQVSASTLYCISSVLGVHVSVFFDGVVEQGADVNQGAKEKEFVKCVQRLNRLRKNPSV